MPHSLTGINAGDGSGNINNPALRHDSSISAREMASPQHQSKKSLTDNFRFKICMKSDGIINLSN
jgi:hypothetical protein